MIKINIQQSDILLKKYEKHNPYWSWCTVIHVLML